ncbi:MAG TPA: D-alanine--D-alanine ligase family protein [Actinomycetota bacterium]|nr:D-alanine--D-alanine ligase family protein [Actinomycetota bacterium]
MKTRVAVMYGGTSEEHEVSVVSARSVLQAIDRDKYDVMPIAITKAGRWLLPSRAPDQLEPVHGSLPAVEDADGAHVAIAHEGALVSSASAPGPIDVVFCVLHGPGGEDGSMQGLFETLDVAYVGAGVAASAVGMDKSLQKPVFAAAGIPVTPWITVREADFARDSQTVARAAAEQLGLPCFTKPANLGSSVGVSKCKTHDELVAGIIAALAHDRVALVERAITGRELECAVLGNDDPQASVVGEVVPAHEFYDYEAKYLVEGSDLIIPARIDDAASERIRAYALDAFRAIGCEGMARVDFFLQDDGTIYINEINTIPGFTPISMYPKLWEASGIPYAKLIDRLLELALERHGRRRRA